MFLPERIIRQPEKRLLVSRVAEIFLRKKETDYVRFSPDGTRKIHLWWDRDSEVSRAGMFSVRPLTKDIQWDDRIFEIARNGCHGDYRFSINIKSVAADSSKDLIHFAHYGEDGTLNISGGSFVHSDEDPSAGREKKLQRGHMLSSRLPPRIHFGETVKRFLFNAFSQNPSFNPPELVPYDALLDSRLEGKELLFHVSAQFK